MNMDLETARKQASEYAMALDLLARISHSGTEKEAIDNILELFTVLFSPQQLHYVALQDGQPEQIHGASVSVTDWDAIRNRAAIAAGKYGWTTSGNGFFVTISHKGHSLGVIEVDAISFPEHKEHYLNLALSIVDVCGLTIENARKYELLTNSEQALRQEKEKVEAALAKVKKLSGLLPICSHCKNIRDDKGYWTRIEAYIQNHSEAEFSHSICRECAKKYYPDMDLYDD